MTVSERKLWLLLFSNFKYRILRQRPIDNYIVDFYCPKLKLVVEIDGESHYTDDGKTYDEVRTYVLEGYGLKVLRFKNSQIMNDFEQVCTTINKYADEFPTMNSPFVKGGAGGIRYRKHYNNYREVTGKIEFKIKCHLANII